MKTHKLTIIGLILAIITFCLACAASVAAFFGTQAGDGGVGLGYLSITAVLAGLTSGVASVVLSAIGRSKAKSKLSLLTVILSIAAIVLLFISPLTVVMIFGR